MATKIAKEEFVHFLRTALVEIDRGASMEGSIRYEWSDEKDMILVEAFVRTGNDQGQGGAILLGGEEKFHDEQT